MKRILISKNPPSNVSNYIWCSSIESAIEDIENFEKIYNYYISNDIKAANQFLIEYIVIDKSTINSESFEEWMNNRTIKYPIEYKLFLWTSACVVSRYIIIIYHDSNNVDYYCKKGLKECWSKYIDNVITYNSYEEVKEKLKKVQKNTPNAMLHEITICMKT